MDDNKVTYFAQTDSRNKKTPFGIKAKDRTRHVYVIGKTGMGKSTLLENMAVQDIQSGEGMCFIDPHGKTAELLLEYVPEHRKNDVLYFAPFDLDHPICFNVLEKVDPDKRHLVVAGLMSTFKKIWVDAWSARMEYILGNTLLALLEYPDATLLGVNRMLSDKEYRKRVVENLTDPAVRSFWIDEFGKYTEKFAAEATPAIQNKIGQFTSNALIRNMIGQPKSSFDFRKMMDEKKIVIVNLSKGRIGESNANLLGGMIITKIYLSAMSRADVPDRVLRMLPNFYLFVDEFQSFANESFADILSEARKYKLNLTMAHQYIEQMEEEVRAAVFGNVGTMIIFRVGAYDAEVLEKEFAPQFTAEDIVNLGAYQIYLKLMIDGISSPPFSAASLPPIKEPERSFKAEAIEASRKQFSLTRKEVEEAINKWHEPMVPSVAPKKDRAGYSAPAAPRERVSGTGTLSDEIKKQIIAHESGDPAVRSAPPARPEAAAAAVSVAPTPRQKASEPVQTSAGANPRPQRVSTNNSAAVTPEPPKSNTSVSARVQTRVPEQKTAAPQKPSGMPHAFRSLAPALESETVEEGPVAMPVEAPKVAPVGLSALKRPESTKNTQKIASPENLSDLRSALAGVLKDVVPAQKSAAKVIPGASMGIKGPGDLKKNHEAQAKVAAPSPSAAAPATAPASHSGSQHKAHAKPHEHAHAAGHTEKRHKTDEPKQDSAGDQSKETMKEIPEEVLRNVLKMEE